MGKRWEPNMDLNSDANAIGSQRLNGNLVFASTVYKALLVQKKRGKSMWWNGLQPVQRGVAGEYSKWCNGVTVPR